MQLFVRLTSSRLEFIQLLIFCFKLAEEHFLQVCNLLVFPRDGRLEIIDRLQASLRRRLVLNESRLERVVLLLWNDGLLGLLGALRLFSTSSAMWRPCQRVRPMHWRCGQRVECTI